MDVFLRADDMGWDHQGFQRLAGLVVGHGAKLNAAAIPLACRQAKSRLDLDRFGGHLEIHSHGLAHLDHEAAGGKSEFGESRREEDVRRDLTLSRETLERMFGPLYFPAFVPPWNRITERFLPLLPDAGFAVLTRDGRPRAQVVGLREHNVNIDLHTSRKPVPPTPRDLLALVEELGASMPGAAGLHPPVVGIMLHHARMDEADFDYLSVFLGLLTEKGRRTLFLSELAQEHVRATA